MARIQSEIDSLKDDLKSVGLAATNAQAAADIAVGLDAKIAAILDKLMSSERKAIQVCVLAGFACASSQPMILAGVGAAGEADEREDVEGECYCSRRDGSEKRHGCGG